MANDDRIQPIPDVPRALEAILQMLQAEPQRYKHYGCYWWAVKRMLKQHGYTQANLYLLGSSTDPEAEAHLPAETDEYLLAHAIEEQKRRAFSEWDSSDCYYPDTGEPYVLFDQDAGF